MDFRKVTHDSILCNPVPTHVRIYLQISTNTVLWEDLCKDMFMYFFYYFISYFHSSCRFFSAHKNAQSLNTYEDPKTSEASAKI